MARDSSGTKNEPQYSPTGAPADAADLTEVAAYAALTGNHKALTSGARASLSGPDRWVGLIVSETDTGNMYQYRSGGWVLLPLFDTGWVQITSFSSGWSAPTNSGRRVGSVRRIGPVVYLQAVFTKGTTWTTGDQVCVLPTGFAPAVDTDMPARLGADVFQIRARASGVVTVHETTSGGGSPVILGSAVWLADS